METNMQPSGSESACIPLPTYDRYNPDHEFWWDECRTSITGLLKHSGESYTDARREAHLKWFRETVVPFLGPEPSPFYRPQSLLNWEGSPYRPSWNFCNDTATVRLGFDPTGSHLGDPSDPFRQDLLGHTIPFFARSSNPPADLTWFNELRQTMYLTPLEQSNLQANWPATTPPPPHHFLAWNLKGSKREFKPYFHPFTKLLGANPPTTITDLIYNAIRNITTLSTKFKPTIDLLESYHRSRANLPSTNPLKLTPGMLGIDCTPPTSGTARLKIYAWAPSNARNLFRDAATLGRTLPLTPETIRAIYSFESIYHLLLDTTPLSNPNTPVHPFRGTPADAATILSWEVLPGRLHPQLKIYFPVWVFHITEEAVVENMAAIFRMFGWTKTAGMYKDAMREAFPRVFDRPCPAGTVRRAERAGTHAWVSFSWSDRTGPYVTVYYAPRVMEGYENNGGVGPEDERATWVWHPAAKGEGEEGRFAR